MKRPLFILIFSVSLVLHGNAQSIGDTASRYLPESSKLMHKVVQGAFGTPAKNIVVLYGVESSAMSYEAMVLMPKGKEYEKFVLPKPEFTWSMEEPKAVLFANVDADAEPELLIIAECYTGIGPTGAEPFNRTRVYDWDGHRFVHLEAVSEKLGNARNAASVRKKIGIR